jgi:hypothetical protein
MLLEQVDTFAPSIRPLGYVLSHTLWQFVSLGAHIWKHWMSAAQSGLERQVFITGAHLVNRQRSQGVSAAAVGQAEAHFWAEQSETRNASEMPFLFCMVRQACSHESWGGDGQASTQATMATQAGSLRQAQYVAPHIADAQLLHASPAPGQLDPLELVDEEELAEVEEELAEVEELAAPDELEDEPCVVPPVPPVPVVVPEPPPHAASAAARPHTNPARLFVKKVMGATFARAGSPVTPIVAPAWAAKWTAI